MTMMAERHAFGTSCGCLSRRVAVLGFAAVMTLFYYIQVLRWLIDSRNFHILFQHDVKPQHIHGCTGTQCYEVFSCFGAKDASHHTREPLSTVTGMILCPLGMLGAIQESRRYLQLFWIYLFLSSLLQLALAIFDGVFIGACQMYPSNVVYQSLLHVWFLPSPLSLAAQSQLRDRSIFPIQEVDAIVGNLDVQAWYFAVSALWVVVLAYFANEAWMLCEIVERGCLGIGVHYGLDQWDQVWDYDAINRRIANLRHSKFVEDAKFELNPSHPDMVHQRGFALQPPKYGSAGALSRETSADKATLRHGSPELGWA